MKICNKGKGKDTEKMGKAKKAQTPAHKAQGRAKPPKRLSSKIRKVDAGSKKTKGKASGHSLSTRASSQAQTNTATVSTPAQGGQNQSSSGSAEFTPMGQITVGQIESHDGSAI